MHQITKYAELLHPPGNVVMIKAFISSMIILILFLSCSDNPTGLSADIYRNEIAFVKEQIQVTRGLNFTRPVTVSTMTREQWSDYNNRWYSNSSSRAITLQLKQLGFVPDTMKDLEGAAASFQDEVVGAFYLPGTDSVVIIGSISDPVALIYYLGHEFVHALQEQHFNAFSNYVMPSTLQSVINSDFFLAQQCVTEGDAEYSANLMLIRLAYEDQSADDTLSYYLKETRSSYFNHLPDLGALRYLEFRSYAPYTLGPYFIMNKMADGGWSEVNRLFHSDRVNSSREIITGTDHEPVVFNFDQITPILLQDVSSLELADDDNYGAVMLIALLGDYLDTENCYRALGLAGDRIIYVLDRDRELGSFVWAMAFDSEEDAGYTFGKLDLLLTNRIINGKSSKRKETAEALVFNCGSSEAHLFLKGTNVFWIENVDSLDSVINLLSNQALSKRAFPGKNASTYPRYHKWRILDRLF